MTVLFSNRLLSVCLLGAGLLVSGCLGPRMELTQQVAPGCTVTNPTFGRSLSAIVGTSFVDGNRVTRLLNGDEIFPAMLKAIKSATNTINLENYMWRSGPLSDEFVA